MNNITQISKFLSLALRHKPDEIGIKMDAHGWVDVDELIEKSIAKGNVFDIDLLEEVVFTSDKQRFTFNEDGTKIRANQGHSIEVNLELVPKTPPEILYHGTVEKFIDSIKKEGLKKGQRQYVHLSKETETANKVGARRGKPFILTVNALEMHNSGFNFYESKNGVWLCDEVPVKYIKTF